MLKIERIYYVLWIFPCFGRYHISLEHQVRTLVDILDRQIDELSVICASKQISMAEVIRQAIAIYIEQNKPATVDAFGIWKSAKVDG
jgi:hypothetical protein